MTKPRDNCCDRFTYALETGDIYLGTLYPNSPAYMTDYKRMVQNKLLSQHLNFAGADGVAWVECPFCRTKLKPPKVKRRESAIHQERETEARGKR